MASKKSAAAAQRLLGAYMTNSPELESAYRAAIQPETVQGVITELLRVAAEHVIRERQDWDAVGKQAICNAEFWNLAEHA